jgi:hypothetical protein
VQHYLRWFGHIQRRHAETPVHSGVIRRTSNEGIDRGRSNLTWKKSVKRDFKDLSITKELALDRRVEASNSCPFSFFCGVVFYCIFSFFQFGFFIALQFPFSFSPFFCLCFLAHMVSSLAYPNLFGTRRLLLLSRLWTEKLCT